MGEETERRQPLNSWRTTVVSSAKAATAAMETATRELDQSSRKELQPLGREPET